VIFSALNGGGVSNTFIALGVFHLVVEDDALRPRALERSGASRIMAMPWRRPGLDLTCLRAEGRSATCLDRISNRKRNAHA
jgi:hypothetical protein